MIDLKNPGVDYRPKPFWSWNDKLETAELRRQIQAMHEAGLGGFFMHARGGLQTQYMGADWFDAIRCCIDEAEKTGMQPYLYDENGWPSGFGDGRVNGLGEKYQQKYLRYKKENAVDAVKNSHTIAILPDPTDAKKVIHLYYDVNRYYIDAMDPEVTEEFLRQIYDTYPAELGVDLWKKCCGFFTDEPQLSRLGIPWSLTLPGAYRKKYGEDLIPLLPLLFFEGTGFRRLRVRFWSLVAELFMHNFMEKIYNWCTEHNCIVTGHHVLEEGYESQLTPNGAIMPQYQFYHIPGIDWLTRNPPCSVAMIQLVSVGAQVGRRQLLTESFALSGWSMGPQGMKWLYQRQMARGVNLLCQHLEGYSLRGLRKRDYPASLFVHQPWWKSYRAFNDYVARFGMLLAEGEVYCKVLMLHGMSTAWMYFNNSDFDRLRQYNTELYAATEALESHQILFHYGDEAMIRDFGKCEDGKFVVGNMRYEVVVLPPLENLSSRTVDLLEEFLRQGGTVLAVENRIGGRTLYLEGEESATLDRLQNHFQYVADYDALVAALARYETARVRLKNGKHASEIIVNRRDYTDLDGSAGSLYFFVNQSADQGYDCEIILEGTGAYEIDAEKGEKKALLFDVQNGNIHIRNHFAPAGELLVFVDNKSTPSTKAAATSGDTVFAELDGEFQLKLEQENTLTLDFCDYYVDGVKQNDDPMPTIELLPALLTLHKVCRLDLDFFFDIDGEYDLSRKINLVMETPEKFQVTLNGEPVSSTENVPYFDHAFRKFALKSCRHGRNVIRLSTKFEQSEAVYEQLEKARCFESEGNKLTFDMELESIYLAGDFAVESGDIVETLPREAMRFAGPFVITEPRKSVLNDDMTSRGYPFFAGRAVLSRTFSLTKGAAEKARRIVFDTVNASTVKVTINGKTIGEWQWQPNELIIPEGVLKEGENEISLEIAGTLRNMLGPHHLVEGESYCVTPNTFYKKFNCFGQHAYNQGWRDDYCVIRFGISGITLR